MPRVNRLPCLLLVLSIVGCGGEPGPEAEVTGKVEMNGKGVSQALVRFTPAKGDTSEVFSDVTDENGVFETKIKHAGTYVVRITKVVGSDGKVPQPKVLPEDLDPSKVEPIEDPVIDGQNILPEQFVIGVPVEIKKGKNELPPFKLD